jgi:hypothetical protein
MPGFSPNLLELSIRVSLLHYPQNSTNTNSNTTPAENLTPASTSISSPLQLPKIQLSMRLSGGKKLNSRNNFQNYNQKNSPGKITRTSGPCLRRRRRGSPSPLLAKLKISLSKAPLPLTLTPLKVVFSLKLLHKPLQKLTRNLNL